MGGVGLGGQGGCDLRIEGFWENSQKKSGGGCRFGGGGGGFGLGGSGWGVRVDVIDELKFL